MTYGISLNEKVDRFQKPLKGTWVFDYSEKSTYSEESISAFYFTTNFIEPPLPEKYARMVQYSDCMVDTTVEIFKERAKRTDGLYYDSKKSYVYEFLDYVHLKTDKPPEFKGKYTEARYDKYIKKYNVWDSVKYSKLTI
jgi:hypothetical protein